MKSRRIFIERNNITHYDKFVRPFKLVDTRFTRIGNKEFEQIVLVVKSAKTGKISREIGTSLIEIENVSGLYYMAYSEQMIRPRKERVFNRETGQEYKIIPIARIVYHGYVIYDLVPIER